MKKTFMGVRLKRLREEQRLTQAALAGKLGISLSYLNQLENNQRPLTVPVLLALNSVFGLDVQSFAEGDEARLISDLREALADPSLGETIAVAELRELAQNMPAVGRALVNLNRKYRHAAEQYAAISARLGEDRQAAAAVLPSTPFEEVRDFFYLQHNYIAELDDAAEAIAGRLELPIGRMTPEPGIVSRKPAWRDGPDRDDRRIGIGNAAPIRWPHTNAAAVAEPRSGPAGVSARDADRHSGTGRGDTVDRRQGKIHQRRSARPCPHRACKLFRRRADLALRRFPQRGGALPLRYRIAQSPVRCRLRDDLPPAQHPAASQRPRRAVLLHPRRSRRQHIEAPVGDRFPFFAGRRHLSAVERL